jgi:hypothetical protein
MADDVKALETAIRELHSPRSGTRRIENNVTLDPPKAVTFCSECEFVEYPCPTIRALEASLPSVEVGEDEALIAWLREVERGNHDPSYKPSQVANHVLRMLAARRNVAGETAAQEASQFAIAARCCCEKHEVEAPPGISFPPGHTTDTCCVHRHATFAEGDACIMGIGRRSLAAHDQVERVDRAEENRG